jgi:hypothetical protein
MGLCLKKAACASERDFVDGQLYRETVTEFQREQGTTAEADHRPKGRFRGHRWLDECVAHVLR